MKIRSLMLGSVAALGLSNAFALMAADPVPAFATREQRRTNYSAGTRAHRKWKRARASGRR